MTQQLRMKPDSVLRFAITNAVAQTINSLPDDADLDAVVAAVMKGFDPNNVSPPLAAWASCDLRAAEAAQAAERG